MTIRELFLYGKPVIVLLGIVMIGYGFSLAVLKEPHRKYAIVSITLFCCALFVLLVLIPTLRVLFVPIR